MHSRAAWVTFDTLMTNRKERSFSSWTIRSLRPQPLKFRKSERALGAPALHTDDAYYWGGDCPAGGGGRRCLTLSPTALEWMLNPQSRV